MTKSKVTFPEMLQILGKREFYLDMAVFFFICVPAVLLILLFSVKLDQYWGLLPFISRPLNWLLFLLFSGAGLAIVWRAYTYLIIIGLGSPCPQLGGTKKLVTCGPYALTRHPSVIGKLSGIIGLGCLSGSPIFTFGVIPLLFIWSVFYNRFIQEKGCVDRFGQDYLNYRKQVPMFIPKIKLK